MTEQCAVPLCLPNNCKWDEQTGEYSKSGGARESLCVVEAALERLKGIKGPVCVVSIAGPCRKGKSYILSRSFDQGEVFPLGHFLDPETMGIWMWIVPDKFKDSNGQEFTVVLLDSEGIDAVSSGGSDDHCIFTLTILLASVLIYNSAGVPTRTDLDGLDFIVKLSQRIQLHSSTPTTDPVSGGSLQADANQFHKTFPSFIWLLRDVVLYLPKDCHSIKDYFLTRVFKPDPLQGNQPNQVAESILKFFPGFDAFKLPPPSSDPEVVTNLNRDEVQQDVNKPFIRGVQDFRAMLRSRLSPKRSFNDGELVTGEALAALVNIYVSALNTPGTVPSVQSAWEIFVHTKCTEAKLAALQVYESTITSELDGLLPCDSDKIRQVQERAIEEGMRIFQEETIGVSASSSEKYLDELMESMNEALKRWQNENNRLTKEQCHKLLRALKEEHLDPVLRELSGKDGASVSFSQIIGGYSAIEQGFTRDARGAKDICAQVFYEFHPEMQAEIEKYMAYLQQLKDFDESLALERQEKARQEQERRRIEEENARLEEERRAKEKEMEILKVKQDEDRRRLEEQFKADMEAQREQMHNMMTANMEELRKDREAIVEQNQTLKEMMEQMRQSMDKRNDQIAELQKQILALANRPPPPTSISICVIS
ncbi:guanylate-binding protein 7-like [Stylophora pistillata]|uniref:Guanylate-binding protein 4 n=1 Tax=Stylophora pistillata TaxID=50429 RepID=A0A2B4S5L7_STYPI|nr:guanylate-binding protein 7-like [Stylophora pistillata]XP_022790074.1 guanylate-binding protein 7-like [Stylophora pistillata]PFX25984.1 Guanylate-binding protein 4 [Stylophora pistillata]